MKIHAPRVVYIVALLRQGLHQANVLIEPVALLVVHAVADAPVVIPPVAQIDANRLLLARQHFFWIDVPAAQIHETADIAQHFSEMVGTLPGDCESRDSARTRAADSM